MAALLAAVEARRDSLAALVGELVEQRTTLGREAGAQAVVERELSAIGFSTQRLEPDAEAALADPSAGYPYLPYEGRSSVAARLPGAGADVRCTSRATSTSFLSSGPTCGRRSLEGGAPRGEDLGARRRAT